MPLVPHHTQAWWIISGVGKSGEIPYILVGQPAPGTLQDGIIAGTKTLSINFNEQCWNHLSAGLQVMHDWTTHSFVLYPLHGYFQGIPSSYWLLVTSLLHHATFWGSTPFRWVIQSEAFPTMTHPHACILPSGGIPQGSFFIHLSERKHLQHKIHQAQLTHCVSDSYIQGKCMFAWHTAPTLLVFQHNLHLFGACAHD